MLTVKWELASGETGQVAVGDGDKWSFGRVGAEEPPTVVTDDPRISRNALTIRDSGPGPVVFRGQRGDAVSITVVSVDGSERPDPRRNCLPAGRGCATHRARRRMVSDA